MNKKGIMFMLWIDIIFFVAIIFLFWKLGVAFHQPNPGEKLGTRQMAVLHSYAMSEQMLSYIDTTAKYAAYEAFHSFMGRGAVNTVDAPCGVYASYMQWTNDEQSCIPSDEHIQASFGAALRTHLQAFLTYPGLPALSYAFRIQQQEQLLDIQGLTEDKITLPILAVKNAQQRTAAQFVHEDGATLLRGTFTPDHPHAVVVESATRAERTTGIENIVLFTSQTPTAARAITQYTEGATKSTQYLVDTQGTIYQFVPETLRARFCDGCPHEDTGIGIALVYEKGCTTCYTTAQRTALQSLLVGVLEHRDLRPEDVVFLSDDDPGKPFLDALSIPSYGAFLAQVTTWQSEERITADETTTTDPYAFPVSWPTDSYTLTSCYGARPYLGDGHHDGIDMGEHNQPVYAFADGTVVRTCEACGGFGKTIVIEHENGIHSRYSHLRSILVTDGPVEKGQKIGLIGNSGFSSGVGGGYHLDFKVYQGAYERARGKNPLCYFDDATLRKLSFTGRNCGIFGFKDHQLTQHHPLLLEDCQGISSYGVAPTCAFTQDLTLGGNELITATKENLRQLSQERRTDFLEMIETVGEEEGVDPRLILAFIAVESRGRTHIVSASGCAGLGQFCLGTAKDFQHIFGFDFQTCSQGRAERTAEEADCVGDPRFDPAKSIRAIPQLLKKKINAFPGLSEKELFGIAAYNGGEGTIQRAIAATGTRDPSWDDVAAALHERIIEEALCRLPNGYFCTRAVQTAKVNEIRSYVPKIMDAFVSLGGSTTAAFSDQTCGEKKLTVKELGKYTFDPSFTTHVPNLLTEFTAARDWAHTTHATCNGADGMNNIACLAEQQHAARVSCDTAEDDDGLLRTFLETTQDCLANQQDMCYCIWDPPVPAVALRIYSEVPEFPANTVQPIGTPETAFQTSADTTPSIEAVELHVVDGERSVRIWESVPATEELDRIPFNELRESFPVQDFIMLKNNNSLTWTAASSDELEAADIPQCGVYKTTHHICFASQQPTYLLSEDRTLYPVIKFALQLDDPVAPEPVTALAATTPAEASLLDQVTGLPVSQLSPVVDVSFTPSTSDDISYYIVECGKEHRFEQGRDATGPYIGTFEFRMDCEPENILLTTETVTVTAYDISGNSQETTTFVTSADVTDLI